MLGLALGAAKHQQIVGADDDDGQRDQGFDESRRRRDDVERRERERDAVADRERRHDQRQPRQRAAEEQQADQEQDVIGPDQDVLDAGDDERLHDRPSALRAARVIRRVLVRCVEDRLQLQRRVLVDVDEGLVNRIVRKHVGVNADVTRPERADGEREPEALAIGHDVDGAPRDRGRTRRRASG